MRYDYEEIRENIQQQIDWGAKVVESVFLQLLDALEIQVLRKIRTVYLVGCGDSRLVGKALEQAFLQYGGLPAHAFSALEFARYFVPFAEPNAILLAISYSGKVSRTVEAARLARQKGVIAIGISQQKTDSPLAEAVHYVFALNTPSTQQIIPGFLSYFASLLAVAIVAVYLGEARSKITSPRADELYYQLKLTGGQAREVLNSSSEKIGDFALRADVNKVWHFLGSGPNFATAEYGALKILESASLPAVWYDIEEWAHSGYFLVSAGTPVIILAPKGKSFNRFKEMLSAIKRLKVELLLITSEDSEEVEIEEGRIIRIAHRGFDETLTPLLFCLPLQWLALRIAERLQSVPFHLDDQNRLFANSQQIYHSQQIADLSELTD